MTHVDRSIGRPGTGPPPSPRRAGGKDSGIPSVQLGTRHSRRQLVEAGRDLGGVELLTRITSGSDRQWETFEPAGRARRGRCRTRRGGGLSATARQEDHGEHGDGCHKSPCPHPTWLDLDAARLEPHRLPTSRAPSEAHAIGTSADSVRESRAVASEPGSVAPLVANRRPPRCVPPKGSPPPRRPHPRRRSRRCAPWSR